jgi:hypothetical protein
MKHVCRSVDIIAFSIFVKGGLHVYQIMTDNYGAEDNEIFLRHRLYFLMRK